MNEAAKRNMTIEELLRHYPDEIPQYWVNEIEALLEVKGEIEDLHRKVDYLDEIIDGIRDLLP